MAGVVPGLLFGDATAHRQDRLGAPQCMALGLSSTHHHGSKIAEENRIRSPMTGSARLSLARSAPRRHCDHLPDPGMPVAHHQPKALLVPLPMCAAM